MGDLFNDLVGNIVAQGRVRSRRLDVATALQLREELARRYAEVGSKISTETIVDYSLAHFNKSNWLLRHYPARPAIAFSNLRDGETMFEFDTVDDAISVLAEAGVLDFYITEPGASYLLAHDEYDNVYGVGAARSFVEELARRNLRSV